MTPAEYRQVANGIFKGAVLIDYKSAYEVLHLLYNTHCFPLEMGFLDLLCYESAGSFRKKTRTRMEILATLQAGRVRVTVRNWSDILAGVQAAHLAVRLHGF